MKEIEDSSAVPWMFACRMAAEVQRLTVLGYVTVCLKMEDETPNLCSF